MTAIRTLLLCGTVLATTACQAGGGTLAASPAQGEVPVLTQHPLSQCPLRAMAPALWPARVGQAPSLVTLASADDWEAYLSRPATDVLPAAVDWGQQRVLLVMMGVQATGGYSLRVTASAWPVNQGVLQAQVQQRTPAPDAMVTQAQTSPCVLVVVPRDGWQRAVLRLHD
jgi:hypothetical protein